MPSFGQQSKVKTFSRKYRGMYGYVTRVVFRTFLLYFQFLKKLVVKIGVKQGKKEHLAALFVTILTMALILQRIVVPLSKSNFLQSSPSHFSRNVTSFSTSSNSQNSFFLSPPFDRFWQEKTKSSRSRNRKYDLSEKKFFHSSHFAEKNKVFAEKKDDESALSTKSASISTKNAPAKWSESSFSTNGIEISYVYVSKSEDLPILVFLHGLTCSGALEIPLFSHLSNDFRVFLPSARGHGKSQPIPVGSFTMPNLVSDAINAIKYFSKTYQKLPENPSKTTTNEEISPVFLGGHSMGAATAARVAQSTPNLVKAVFLEDPPWLRLPGEPILPSPSTPNPFPESRALKSLSPSEFSLSNPKPSLERVGNLVLPFNDPLSITHRESLRQFDADVIEPTFRTTDDDINEAVLDIRVPVVLQTGGPEAVCTEKVAEAVLKSWPKGREKNYPKAGHLIHASVHNADWIEDVKYFFKTIR